MKYRGVYYSGEGVYRAVIRVGGKTHHLGTFKDELEAAEEYDRAALHYRGDKAILNSPKKVEEYKEDPWVRKARPRGKENRYVGVCYHIRRKKYLAHIRVDGRRYNLGWYDEEEEAARVRDRAAIELVGEEAKLNFPGEI